MEIAYKRILLKLSGEALAGERKNGKARHEICSSEGGRFY